MQNLFEDLKNAYKVLGHDDHTASSLANNEINRRMTATRSKVQYLVKQYDLSSEDLKELDEVIASYVEGLADDLDHNNGRVPAPR